MQQAHSTAPPLTGRVAVVTGGGGTNSIGRAISVRLAAEGARVAVLDIDDAGAARVAAEITRLGGTALAVHCDVTDLAMVEATMAEVAAGWDERVDILVNNAALFGGMGEKRPFDEWTVDEWNVMQDVNVRGMWFCARAAVPFMKVRGYGKIVNVTSDTFFHGVAGFIHYTASKGGVIGFTRSLARELGEFGIRVNAAAPGFTLSDAQLAISAPQSDSYDVIRSRQTLAARNEMPEDLAGPVYFLASADSDFMTGQTLLVDGGYSMH